VSEKKVQTIRFSEREWREIQRLAAVAGISASQWVRNAARAMVIVDRMHR
jgi:hypothetical protein